MDVIVIGASAAGLAAAKTLRDQGIEAQILEGSDRIGLRWHNHYRRLHLHTPKGRSTLPGMAFPANAPKYPPRQMVEDYLIAYAERFDLRPEFGQQVSAIRPEAGGWRVETPTGPRHCDQLVLATGYNNVPVMPDKPGLDSFPGRVLHSAEYRSGAEFKGQRVLVVGFGNSGCEIAIDLHEQGARPAISIRGQVNVLPRDVLGIPVLALGQWLRHFPPGLIDRLNAPALRLMLGDLRALGLRPLPYGPMAQIARGQVPLLDIGTLDLMRQGAITRHDGITAIEGARVTFDDGRAEEFDAIVFATGYRHGIERLLDLPKDQLRARIEGLQQPMMRRPLAGAEGLWIMGGYLSPRGMLYELAREAEFMAPRIAAKAA